MINKQLYLGMIALTFSVGAFGHGLISEPASRNWLCGAVTKPDQAAPGSACAQAFEGDFNGGYQFMSVLTHDVGRAGVSPLPTNVCGFDSETWQGGATPWDKPIDWPTHAMSAGPLTITWDIAWGPHYDDTEEFRYWITKPNFQYEVGHALTWDDFEEDAFCVLSYNDATPNANPNVVPDKANTLFHTTCNIPQRSGRHVIYAEWGRNQWTYERFHGCIDASFDGSVGPVVTAQITASPSDSIFAGEGTIQLSAAGSAGDDLSYQWSIEAPNPALYTLSSTSTEAATLQLANPQAQSQVVVRLLVSSGNATSNASFAFTHIPVAGAAWADLGAVSASAQTLDVGDQVQLRLVRTNGQDAYAPSSPLVIDASTTLAAEWTYALAQAVNAADAGVQLGVLNNDGDVVPVSHATNNRVYASMPSDFANAFVQIQGQGESSSSSSSVPEGQQCNWYGSLHPLCENTQVDWGWENGRSCVAASTCSAQPAPYGIVGASSSAAQSSAAPQSSSAPASSSGQTSSAPATGNCTYEVTNEWSDGFTAVIRITNNGSAAIGSWSVSWSYTDGSAVTNSWNAGVTGSNPYQAVGQGWNVSIPVGETAEFGFQGTKGGGGAAQVPAVTGTVCQ